MPRNMVVVLFVLSGFCMWSGTALAEAGKECPWRISQVTVGKWANGQAKASIWVSGSFPINIPGVTERPDWYINGNYVGKSQIFFSDRLIPNASSRFYEQKDNTIKVQFKKPPLAGTSHQCVISGFSWGHVTPGGYKYYRCK